MESKNEQLYLEINYDNGIRGGLSFRWSYIILRDLFELFDQQL